MIEMPPKIWISTHAYNAEKTISRTIESILGQTYKNFSYLIRDNGSTDDTYSICEKYASKDSRIKIVRNSINNFYESEEGRAALDWEDKYQYGYLASDGDYTCTIDADDEYSLDFFQRAILYAQKENLDIVIGGSELVSEENKTVLKFNGCSKEIIIEGEMFSDYFPIYHWFVRQKWGKLFRKGIIINFIDYYRHLITNELGDNSKYDLPYGVDTLTGLYSFNNAQRIGILPGIGYKCYIQQKSTSSILHPNRIESDWILNYETEKFLINKCGYISEDNRLFLAAVYANAVTDTLYVIHCSSLENDDKLKEYSRMAAHPITKYYFAFDLSDVVSCKKEFIYETLICFDTESNEAINNFNCIIAFLTPRCKYVVNTKTAKLFLDNYDLRNALYNDDINKIVEILVEMLIKNDQTKKYDLFSILKKLSLDNPLLKDISNKKFIRQYGNIYNTIFKNEYENALNKMTEILTETKKGMDETFLWLYVTLAALLEKTDEFLYGKLRSAGYHLYCKKYDECRSELNDLAEMGVEDNDEIIRIKKELDAVGK